MLTNNLCSVMIVDRDVLEWFQAQGDRADLQMELALKIYTEANKADAIDL
jgi:uncharacterized protein (DUF4415 family)